MVHMRENFDSDSDSDYDDGPGAGYDSGPDYGDGPGEEYDYGDYGGGDEYYSDNGWEGCESDNGSYGGPGSVKSRGSVCGSIGIPEGSLNDCDSENNDDPDNSDSGSSGYDQEGDWEQYEEDKGTQEDDEGQEEEVQSEEEEEEDGEKGDACASSWDTYREPDGQISDEDQAAGSTAPQSDSDSSDDYYYCNNRSDSDSDDYYCNNDYDHHGAHYSYPAPNPQNDVIVLYHYTDHAGYEGICRTRVIHASGLTGQDAVFGQGVYFTTLDPTVGKQRIAWNNWDGNAINAWKIVRQMVSSRKVDHAIKMYIPRNDPRIGKAPSGMRDVYLYSGHLYIDYYHHEIIHC